MYCQNSQSKVRYKLFNLIDTDVLVAEFRESIKPAVPEIISFLSDSELNVCMAAADALSKLSEKSKLSKFLACTLLMYS